MEFNNVIEKRHDIRSILQENKGFQMLLNSSWIKDSGLGRRSQRITSSIELIQNQQRLGLRYGKVTSEEVEKQEDKSREPAHINNESQNRDSQLLEDIIPIATMFKSGNELSK